MSKELRFSIVPQHERYYSDDSNYGVYVFTTSDDIPEYKPYSSDPFSDTSDIELKSSILSGKMQRLYLGTEYEVTASLTYNEKYRNYQYVPKVVSAKVPKTVEQQELFLKTIITENQAEVLLEAYPNIVNEVVNNQDHVDLSQLKGIKEYTWNRIREKIIDNYVVSDILTMLQPLGVTYNMVKRLLSEESNPALLKEKLLENPYIMTKVRGFGFKTVDGLALKIKPELRVSKYRTIAFVNYYLRETGENEGHTWVKSSMLENAVIDNIHECIDEYHQFISEQRTENNQMPLLKVLGNRIGLAPYFDVEKNILDILLELDRYESNWDLDIDSGIKKSENEQGFQFSEEQISIIQEAVKHNITFISGKAGTGKTSIARALLNIYSNAGKTIACCALSAKAAQRITEATEYPASTIHRLLKAQGYEFFHNADNPLMYDVVLVDECSMINSGLYYSLISAVKPGSRIIMCGDNRQLPPIGYGNIFSDFLDRKNQFNINCLKTVHRQAQKSGILTDANKIRDGICPIAKPDLKIKSGELQDMIYMFRDNREQLRNIAVRTFLKSVETDGLDSAVIIVPRKNKCINSTFEINRIIQDELLPDENNGELSSISFGEKTFRIGAKVIQRVNDYDKNIFNGEIGYVKKIWQEQEGSEVKTKFMVEYKSNNPDENSKEITYSKNEMDQLDLAYALTIHLSQGSGYKKVIVVIDNTHYTLLDSCLLYTAITRSKEKCLLLSEPSAFKKCIQSNKSISRQTWLPLLYKSEI